MRSGRDFTDGQPHEKVQYEHLVRDKTYNLYIIILLFECGQGKIWPYSSVGQSVVLITPRS